MTPKLFRAVDVCELAQLQPYVLRSWEKEFPGIGVQKDADSPRLYRQSDLDQVLRIKQLVFSEGLTLAGARRRLEESAPRSVAEERQEVAEVLDALASDARTRIAHVRDGLRSILQLLSGAPGTVVVVDLPAAGNGRGKTPATVTTMPVRGKLVSKPGRVKAVPQKEMPKASRAAKGAKAKVVAKAPVKKRSRASA
jgi:DNA-binding transcriptional MerR regulator